MDWADIDDDDHIMLPPVKETVDKHGIRTTIKYEVKDGKKIKKTTRVRIYKFQKRVYHAAVKRRQTWKKFGEVKDKPAGPEDNITYTQFDEVVMEDPNAKEEEDGKDKEKELAESIMKSFGQGKWREKNKAEGGPGLGGEGGKPGGYVPPHMRGAGGAAAAASAVSLPQRESMGSRFRDDGYTLRVTNISEDTKEADLQDLFRPFGRVVRIYLAKDRQTMQSRGFAFVTYGYKEDAEKAMNKLNGYGYDHLILKIEWAKPSTRDAGPGGNGLSGGFVSGYGKALPQGMGK